MSDEPNRADDLLKEMARVAKAFQQPDQTLELDIQKIVNSLRSHAKVPRDQIEALENILHEPEALKWKPMNYRTELGSDYKPSRREIEFFELMIAAVGDGAEWAVPATGQVYKIDKKSKTFTLTKDTENDKDNWHSKTKLILASMGWKMNDTESSARSFTAEKDGWVITVFDFSIENQENPKTPGQNFPPGSRGQDAMAMQAGAVVRLSHRIGRMLIRHVSSDFGVGKSTAASTQTGSLENE